jgi:hypothetical protein
MGFSYLHVVSSSIPHPFCSAKDDSSFAVKLTKIFYHRMALQADE